MLLLRDNADTGDDALTAALVRYFTEDTLEASRLDIRGACLVGFSMEDYPNPFEDGQEVRADIQEGIDRWRSKLGTTINTHSLDSFEIEVFCVPLPSVQDFRDALLAELGLTS